MKYILTIVLLIMSSIAFCQKNKTLSRGDVSIEYPSDWRINDFQTCLIFIREPSNGQDKLLSSFDVIVSNKYESIDDFFDYYLGYMKDSKTYLNFQMKSRKDIEFNGYKAVEIICTADVRSDNLAWRSIIFRKKETTYKVTLTGVAEDFSQLKKDTEIMFESFRFNE